jgi:hypothetical protein
MPELDYILFLKLVIKLKESEQASTEEAKCINESFEVLIAGVKLLYKEKKISYDLAMILLMSLVNFKVLKEIKPPTKLDGTYFYFFQQLMLNSLKKDEPIFSKIEC